MKGIWITPEEIAQLPTSGTAWESVFSTAQNAWGSPNLADQNNKHGLRVLAGALVATKMDSETMRGTVRAAVMAAKRTFDQPQHWGTSNGVLAFGRLAPAYIIAADLVGLGADDAEFSGWLRTMLTQKIGTHGRWNTLTGCHEDDAANWAAFAGAARVAIAAYLGDAAELDRCELVLRALFGERELFPGGGYFNPSSGTHWATSDPWIGINGPGSKEISGAVRDLDGCPVIDTGDGGLGWPPSSTSYPWECMQGWTVQAEILHRMGYPAYEWSNQALRRAGAFMFRTGKDVNNPARHVVWILNARYSESFPVTSPNTDGRAVTWTDWTHAVGVPPPPPGEDPLTISGFFPTSGRPGTEVEIRGTGLHLVNAVYFNNVLAPGWTHVGGESVIRVSVPPNALTGSIILQSTNEVAVSESPFTVTSVDPDPPPPGAPDPRVPAHLAISEEYYVAVGRAAAEAAAKIAALRGAE